jgi:hypothetical protein
MRGSSGRRSVCADLDEVAVGVTKRRAWQWNRWVARGVHGVMTDSIYPSAHVRSRFRRDAVRTIVATAVLMAAGCAPGQPAPRGTSEAQARPSATPKVEATGPLTTPRPEACGERALPAPAEDDGTARPAVEATLALFDDSPIVAIGEYHGWPAQHVFLEQLVCHPRFPAVVDVVVIEFGNRRLQSVLDRYVGGEVVSVAELASIWRESTQRSGVFENPVYERFLSLVRSVNQRVTPADQIDVLAGDPPIDYATVERFSECSSEDPTCYDYWIMRREESFATVVIEDVLARDRTALLLAGAGHMVRRPAGDDRPPSIPDRIEAVSPGATNVILPHRGIAWADAASEERIRGWPVASLALLDGSWVGNLDACVLEGERDGMSDAPCPDGLGPTLSDIADAYLYVGPS